MRRGWVRLVQWALAAAVLGFAGAKLARHWDELRAQPLDLAFRPWPLLGAALVTWLMYAILVQAWRTMLAGWGSRLDLRTAARIWTVSSLGKYLPGKVWAIAGMAVMSQRVGVPAWAATGSAVILQALAVGTGAVVVGTTGMAALESRYPWFGPALVGVAALSALGTAALLSPRLMRRLLAIARVDPGRHASPGAASLAFGVAANLVAWVGYGIALWLLVRGILPAARLELPVAIAAFTASYLAGLLALFMPGGLLIREGAVFVLLQGPLGPAGAGAVAIASRILLTITEFGAAAPFVLVPGERTRVLN